MNARLITPVLALLCVLPIAAKPGQMVGNVEVFEGPTPFIRFVNTNVSDVAGFKFAQFLIWPKTGSATRPIICWGDDPSLFVYPAPTDWFHNNATAYRSSDNSLIVSSRENFVIAIDYDSGNIKWILGDPTKHWYEFPSLRAFSLTVAPGTLPPIGQHAVSVPGNQLLLFDDGAGSNFQQPPGETRNYSAPRKYQIDLNAFEATETWHYYPDPSVYSPFCSSVYEDAPNNYLIDYTLGGPYIYTGIVGLDSLGNVAFNYQYQELDFCGTAWNAIQIHWENLRLQ